MDFKQETHVKTFLKSLITRRNPSLKKNTQKKGTDMKTCSRVKNPCKICFQTVTNKTGLQCQGACKNWAHFTCLQYTPGKIADIKAGVINITCPCPNCNTQVPKEYLTNPPFTCDNQECPANKVPKCQQIECPANKVTSRDISPQETQIGAPCVPTCATSKSSRFTPPTSSPEVTKIPAVSSQPQTAPSPPKVPEPPKEPEPRRVPSIPPVVVVVPRCANYTNEIPPCNSIPVVSEHATPPRAQSSRTATPRTDTPVRFSRQKDVGAQNTPTQMKSVSCSCITWPSGVYKKSKEMVNAGNQGGTKPDDAKTVVLKSGDCKETCSDSKLNKKDSQKVLICTIQDLCSTVGELSNQIKNLMCKMMTSMDKDKDAT